MSDDWPDFWAQARSADILAVSQSYGARLKKTGAREFMARAYVAAGLTGSRSTSKNRFATVGAAASRAM